jgi:hypothetical protein
MILQRMGPENCGANTWAISLRDLVIKNFKGSDEMLTFEESERNEQLSRNNHKIYRLIKKRWWQQTS